MYPYMVPYNKHGACIIRCRICYMLDELSVWCNICMVYTHGVCYMLGELSVKCVIYMVRYIYMEYTHVSCCMLGELSVWCVLYIWSMLYMVYMHMHGACKYNVLYVI